MRPKIFIGSSKEGLNIAKAIQVSLEPSCEVSLWSNGAFGLSDGTLESLVKALDEFDFAIFMLTPDDMIISRDQPYSAPRDNVIFEMGLFVGRIGRERTFAIYELDKDIKIPSDLAGITLATFKMHSDGNLISSLSVPTYMIQNKIEEIGIMKEIPKVIISNRNKNMYTIENKELPILLIIKNGRCLLQWRDDWGQYLFPIGNRSRIEKGESFDRIMRTSVINVFGVAKNEIEKILITNPDQQVELVRFSSQTKSYWNYIYTFYVVIFHNEYRFPETWEEDEFEANGHRFKWASIEQMQKDKPFENANYESIKYLDENTILNIYDSFDMS